MAEVDEEAMDSTIGIITYARYKSNDYGEKSYEFKVTTLDNTVSDVLVLDKVKTYDKLKKAEFFADNEKTESAQKKAQVEGKFGDTAAEVEAYLGSVVRYAINGDKLTIAEIAYDTTGSGDYDVYTSYDEAKITPIEGTIDVDKDKIGSYRRTSSTVVYTMTEGDEDYEIKLEEVEFDDLADDEFVGYALDIDEDTNKVKYFISVADLSKDDNLYAVVKSVATSDVDDEKLITLLTLDGAVELAIDDDEVTENVVKGAVVKYNKGDKITDLTVVTKVDKVADLESGKVIAFNEDSIKVFVPATTGAEARPATYKFVDSEEELLILTYDSEDGTKEYCNGLKIAKGLPDVDTFEHMVAGDDDADTVIFLYKLVDEEPVVYGLIYAE